MAKKDGIKQLEEKIADLENQFKRAVADYQNLEKRIQEDIIVAVGYSKAQLINKVLPALDSLDQAVEGANGSEANSGWLKGTMMAVKQLRQALAEEGLVEIDTSGKFDPVYHEAVDIQEGDEGKILQVVLRGYTLNGRVIRPAKVVVGKSQPRVEEGENKDEMSN